MLSIEKVDNIEKITNLLDKNAPSQVCEMHNLPQRYCCPTCDKSKSFCIECYYLTHDQSHHIYPISKVANDKKDVFMMHLNNFEEQYEYYKNDLLVNVNKKISEVVKTRDKNLNFINMFKTTVEKRFGQIMTILTQHKQQIQLIMKDILSIIHELRAFYCSDIIKEKGICDSIINEIKKFKNNNHIEENQIVLSQITELDPFNFNNTFNMKIKGVRDIIKGKHNTKKILNNICVNFLNVSSLIFLMPNGKQNQSINVFLGVHNEMPDGFEIKLYYKVEMVNVKGKRNLVKECKSPFGNKNRFKGWKNYYEVDKLEENGFINKKGEIDFLVTIYPENAEEFLKSVFLVSKS